MEEKRGKNEKKRKVGREREGTKRRGEEKRSPQFTFLTMPLRSCLIHRVAQKENWTVFKR